MLSDEKLQWLQTTLKINVRHKDVEVPEQEDFLRRARGKEYEGEEKQVGFRAGAPSDLSEEGRKQHQSRVEDTHRVTQMYTDEEVAQNKVHVGDKGKLQREDGERVDGKMIYAVEAESGEMVTGEENKFRLIDTKTGEEYKTNMSFLDAAKFARSSKGAYRFDNLHHSSLVQGEDVRGAGTIEVARGEIRGISNTSGHYKPRFEHLLQVVEGLISSGALLEQDVVDHEGRSVKESMPKAYELYTKLQPRIASLGKDKARIIQITTQLEGETLSEEDGKSLGGELDRLERGVDLVTKGLDALRKMGIGASNRLKDVDVTLNFADERKTGLEFVTSVATDKMKLSDFVMGQGSAKPNLLDPSPLEMPEVTMSEGYLRATIGEDGTLTILPPVETKTEADPEISNKYLVDDTGENHVIYSTEEVKFEELAEDETEENVEVTTNAPQDDQNKYLSDQNDHDTYILDENVPVISNPQDSANSETRQDEVTSNPQDDQNKYLTEETGQNEIYTLDQDPKDGSENKTHPEKTTDPENQSLRGNLADNSYVIEQGVKTFDSGRVEEVEVKTSPLHQNLDVSTYTLEDGVKNFADGHVEEEKTEVGTSNTVQMKYLHEQPSEETSEETPVDTTVQPKVSTENQNNLNLFAETSYTIEDGMMTFGDGRVEAIVKTPQQIEQERQAEEKKQREEAEKIRKEQQRKAASRQAGGKNDMLDELKGLAEDGELPLAKDGIKTPDPVDAPYQGEDLTDDVKGTVTDEGEEVAAKLLKTREEEEKYLERLRQERLAEAKSAGEEIRKGLRPEDREGGTVRETEGKHGTVKDTTISEGEAPEIDLGEWNKEVSDLTNDLDRLNRDTPK